jgi:hypothetical protein
MSPVRQIRCVRARDPHPEENARNYGRHFRIIGEGSCSTAFAIPGIKCAIKPYNEEGEEELEIGGGWDLADLGSMLDEEGARDSSDEEGEESDGLEVDVLAVPKRPLGHFADLDGHECENVSQPYEEQTPLLPRMMGLFSAEARYPRTT